MLKGGKTALKEKGKQTVVRAHYSKGQYSTAVSSVPGALRSKFMSPYNVLGSIILNILSGVRGEGAL
jgi:hypothetical protein